VGRASDRVLRTLGDLHFANGDFGPAADVYEEAFAKTTPDAMSLERLVECLARSGRHEALVTWSGKLAATGEGAVEGRLRRARALLELGRTSEADGDLAELRRLAPDDGEVLLLAAGRESESGKLDEAEKMYRGLTSLTGFEGRGWAGLGRIRMKRGRFEEALEAMNKALEYDPGNPSYYALASVLDRTLRR
jgi:tetratricopeptide (TPR) repeat protein